MPPSPPRCPQALADKELRPRWKDLHPILQHFLCVKHHSVSISEKPLKEVLCCYGVQMRNPRKVRGLPLAPRQRLARVVTLQQSTADCTWPLTAGLQAPRSIWGEQEL